MHVSTSFCFIFFFFNDTATTEIYTFPYTTLFRSYGFRPTVDYAGLIGVTEQVPVGSNPATYRGRTNFERSEEHTSELQSLRHLVCRLLLEKKKKIHQPN